MQMMERFSSTWPPTTHLCEFRDTKYNSTIWLTFAKSIGWITTDAKVAAEPPHTNGSNALAKPLFDFAVIDLLISTFEDEDAEAAAMIVLDLVLF